MFYFYLENLVDENGVHVERTPTSHPYSYDGHVLMGDMSGKKADDTVYTDRMLGWDRKKHDELCQKHFGNTGQFWDNRDWGSIENFMKDWTGNDKLELVRVMQYCNHSSGYPTWRIDYLKNE